MRIVHIDTGREMRGGQHQLLLLLQGLSSRNHDQFLLARQPTRSRVPNIESGEPSILHLRRAAQDADLIHAHDGRGHTLAAAAFPNKPIVVSRRVAFPVKTGLLSRWKYKQADHYIAISKHVKQQLEQAGIPDEKISIVYDGVMLPDETARERTIALLTPKINDPLKGAALLNAVSRKAGLDPKFSRDLLEDLPRAKLFVYLSENEGLGSAILLAMARHTPVIASNIGGIPELIEHEVTGLLVDNRPDDIAAAIGRFSADAAFAQACAERAYKRIKECFRDDIMTERTEQIYRAILANRSPL